jgi:hypothetical protein
MHYFSLAAYRSYNYGGFPNDESNKKILKKKALKISQI